MTDITLKLGATLRLRVTRTSEDGSPRDLSGLTVTSALGREVGGLVFPISVDASEAAGRAAIIDLRGRFNHQLDDALGDAP